MATMMVRGTLALAAVAVVGAVAGAGPAGADAYQVDGNYATLAACQADGPHYQKTVNGGSYTHWSCDKGEDGLYYLYLST